MNALEVVCHYAKVIITLYPPPGRSNTLSLLRYCYATRWYFIYSEGDFEFYSPLLGDTSHTDGVKFGMKMQR